MARVEKARAHPFSSSCVLFRSTTPCPRQQSNSSSAYAWRGCASADSNNGSLRSNASFDACCSVCRPSQNARISIDGAASSISSTLIVSSKSRTSSSVLTSTLRCYAPRRARRRTRGVSRGQACPRQGLRPQRCLRRAEGSAARCSRDTSPSAPVTKRAPL